MKLNAPTKPVFLIALILGILAVVVVATTVSIPIISGNAFWVMTVAWGLLTLGCLLKGV